jgi:hypothetical protein
MEANEVIKVIEKLIGKIEPVADSAIDSQRKDNIEKYLEVLQHMYSEVHWVAMRHKDSPYGSQKEIGQMCNKFLKHLNDEYET